MKPYAFTLAAMILLLPLAPAAVPQQTPPPPSNQVGSGPSLAVTMQFIQDKMDDIKVNFVVSSHDANSGNDFTNTITEEITNAMADPKQCRIAYHQESASSRGPRAYDFWFLLRDVQDVVVEPYVQYENEAAAAGGFPNMVVSSTNPPLTALLVRRLHGDPNLFPFTDHQLADRVAKAMVHVVELCGGGNSEPF